jgi:ribose transport system ATP-binding protein
MTLAAPAPASTTGAFTLRARQIRKSFGGVEVLHGVDLDATGGSVLALLGENGAGKSTLVKIIAGDYTPDAGEIVIDGTAHAALTPLSARSLGIAIIFQEFQDAPTLTVAENISLGRLPHRAGLVDWAAVRERARRILGELEVDIDPDARVDTLRVGERQIVEIARALSASARLLILDEPTAALSHHEAEALFAFVRRLRNQGVAIIYITHRLDEVFRIADRVQVLRDGDVALVADVASTDRAAMIEAMIGRRISQVERPPAPQHPIGDRPVIRWVDASSGRAFQNVSLEVRSGEIVAIYGKLGSGAAEVGESAYGLRPLEAGRLEVDGAARQFAGPAEAIEHGVGFLPAERKAGGAFMVRPVAENVAVASWPLLAVLRAFISERARSEGLPALARASVHPLPKRSQAADGDPVRRQPAEGALGALAGAERSRPRPHRADSRGRRRGSAGHLQGPSRVGRSGGRCPDQYLRLRGGGSGGRPRLRHGQGPGRGPSERR